MKPKIVFLNFLKISSLLYLFLLGLELMSTSFKILSVKGIHSVFSFINNPISGVMIGIISTVLLQSSSTTTSIIVTMVGSNIINVKQAIPLVMGANIGTSITNTLVAHAHIADVEQFKLAFSGATVHDMFNFLSLIFLLSIESITQLFNFPLIYEISDKFTKKIINTDGLTFKSPFKIILNPIVKNICSIDKNILKQQSTGCINCNNTLSYCWNHKKKLCITELDWNDKYNENNIIKGGFLKSLGTEWGGIVGLIISLVFLCFSLYFIVKTLHKIVMKDNGQGRILSLIKKTLEINPYLTMIIGMILTMAVQSSSIITSTFTPLVGLSIITIEQMYLLTLGANVGTTFTSILASIVTGSVNAIQISICHFLFNIFGIIIWYPIPFMRKIPIIMAKRLGILVSKYKWFGIFYIIYTFGIFPVLSYSISLMININNPGLIFGIIILLLYAIVSFYLFFKFEIIFNYIQLKHKKILDKYRACRYSNIDDNVIEMEQIEEQN